MIFWKRTTAPLDSSRLASKGGSGKGGDIICACRCRCAWSLGEVEVEAQEAAEDLFPAAD